MSDGAVPGGRGAGGVPGGPSLGERRLAEETRERFLREIVARVALDRLAAVHLFRPMRQGGFESGVAVIAAELPTPEVPHAAVPDAGAAPEAAPEAAAPEPTVTEPAPVPSVDDEATDVASGADTIAEPACDPTDAAAGPSELPETAADEAAVPQEEADTVVEAGPEVDAEAEAVAEPAPDARPVRHTVFTARYRLAIKGPDRGKWEVEVVEEADAPMVTVEAVVRGVLRRAGDEADPERLDAAAVARLVGAADPRAAAPP